MILKHPLNKENEANKKAIEKYKDRKVYVFNKNLQRWLKLNYALHINPTSFVFDIKANRSELTFKEALKLTKHFLLSSNIEYHFIDDLGEEKPDIKDFNLENVINCPTVVFDDINSKKYKIH